jgi:hypothetical protein
LDVRRQARFCGKALSHQIPIRPGGGPGEQILPLGRGELDLQLLKKIGDSGYAGPIGLLNHTDEDAEGRLLDNRDGLEWLRPLWSCRSCGFPPTIRSQP